MTIIRLLNLCAPRKINLIALCIITTTMFGGSAASQELRNFNGFFYVTKYGIDRIVDEGLVNGDQFWGRYVEDGTQWGGFFWHSDTQQPYWIARLRRNRCNNGWSTGNWSSTYKNIAPDIWESTLIFPKNRRRDANKCFRWTYLTNPCEKERCEERWGPVKDYSYFVSNIDLAQKVFEQLR